MSKSVGNVVRPDQLVADFGPDALRYFLMREMAFGQDANFSDEAFLDAVQRRPRQRPRQHRLARRGALPAVVRRTSPPEVCDDNEVDRRVRERAESDWRAAMDEFAFNRGLEAIWRFLSEINGYVVSREPWKIRKEEGVELARGSARVLYAASEGVRLAAAAALALHAGDVAEDLRGPRRSRRRTRSSPTSSGARLPTCRRRSRRRRPSSHGSTPRATFRRRRKDDDMDGTDAAAPALARAARTAASRSRTSRRCRLRDGPRSWRRSASRSRTSSCGCRSTSATSGARSSRASRPATSRRRSSGGTSS